MGSSLPVTPRLRKLHFRLALPQLILAGLALTSYHVQIITRQSSGYPYWYIWLAAQHQNWQYWHVTVRVFMMYALIQAGIQSGDRVAVIAPNT